MRIRRFNENIDIAQDRREQIIDELDEFLSILSDKDKYLDTLISELKNYQDVSNDSNDQIDDSIEQLEISKKDISNAFNKIDKVLENLKSYKDENRKPLYGDQTKDF